MHTLSNFEALWSTTISPWLVTHGLAILVIIVGGYVLNSFLNRFIIRIVRLSVRPDRHESPEAEVKREDTLIRIFHWAMTILIFVTGSMMVLQEIGVPIGPILAGAGIAGIALGFGGQYMIRDFITGFFLILENQYRIGDVVSLDQTSGAVEDISLRMTTLRDLSGTVHYVPHGDIKRVSNMSKVFSRINLNVGIAYEANMDKVIEVINRVGEEFAKDPVWSDTIISAPQFLRVEDFSDSSVTLKIVGDTKPTQQWAATGELRRRLKEAFDKEGIEIPFPQRVIRHIHKDGDKSETTDAE